MIKCPQTGYIIPTVFDYAKRSGRQELFERAVRMAEWECRVQMPNGAVQGGTVVLDDFNGNGTHDDVDRYHDAEAIFLAEQNSRTAGEWTGDYTDTFTYLQKGVRLSLSVGGKALAKRLDLTIVDSNGTPARAHKPDHAGKLQHSQTVDRRNADEEIAGE